MMFRKTLDGIRLKEKQIGNMDYLRFEMREGGTENETN